MPPTVDTGRTLKRPSDEADDARIVKRLNMMQLDPHSQLYVPITPDGTKHRLRTTAGPELSSPEHVRDLLARIESPPSRTSRTSPPAQSSIHSSPSRSGPLAELSPATAPPAGDDWMQIDSTADRVFIASIDDELVEENSDEPGARSSAAFPIFVGDIERHLMGMPRPMRLLAGDDLRVGEKNQMVLYRPLVVKDLPDSVSGPDGTSPAEDGSYDGDDEVDVVEMPDDWVGRASQYNYSDTSSDSDPEAGVGAAASVPPGQSDGPEVVEIADDNDMMIDD